MKRLREWVQARIDAVLLPVVRRCMPDQETILLNAIRMIDRKDLAWHVDTPDFRQNVAQFVKEQLEGDIDLGEIAEKLGERIDASDIAYHLNAADVAAEVDVDLDAIAEKVAGEIDVSSCVDYDKLAEALVSKLKEAWA